MSSDNIMPSLDELTNAVIGDMDGVEMPTPRPSAPAVGNNPFDATQWYLQRYPVVVKPKAPKPKHPQTDTNEPTTIGSGYSIYSGNVDVPVTPTTVTQPPTTSSGSNARKWFNKILATAVIILCLVFIPYMVETTDFSPQNDGVHCVENINQLNQLIQFLEEHPECSTRDVINNFGKPHLRSISGLSRDMSYTIYDINTNDSYYVCIEFDYFGNVTNFYPY